MGGHAFSVRTSALWLRRAAVLPAIALVGLMLWLNHLAPMRMVDLALGLFAAAGWGVLVYWGLLIRSPAVILDEHGLRIRSGPRRGFIPWSEVLLEKERPDALELRVGGQRLVVQPSHYAQPDVLRRFVISHVHGGSSRALTVSGHKAAT